MNRSIYKFNNSETSEDPQCTQLTDISEIEQSGVMAI